MTMQSGGASRYSLQPLADDIALNLHDALRRRLVSKIGIDEIRAAINDRLGGKQYSADAMDMLEKLVTQRVVEIAG